MDFSKIDKNFTVDASVDRDDIIWLESDKSPFKVYGAYSCNPYKRIPTEIAEKTSDGVNYLHTNTAGIRIRFRTDSPYVAVHAEWNEFCNLAHMPLTGSSSFDIFSYNELTRKQLFVASLGCPSDSQKGFDSLRDLSGKMQDYIINFPLYNDVDKLYIGVAEGAQFEEPAKYTNELPVVYYGSSITQGGCASRPANSYQNILSRALDIDYINLGFSGNCRAEDVMVDYLANLKMCAFVSDYDHNAPTPEYLKNTHYKMYQKIREKNPDIPYIMISKPDFNYSEDNDMRRTVIMESYCKAVANGDKNVYFVDGASIFRGEDFNNYTVDTCHPTDIGFYHFAEALFPTLKIALFGK